MTRKIHGVLLVGMKKGCAAFKAKVIRDGVGATIGLCRHLGIDFIMDKASILTLLAALLMTVTVELSLLAGMAGANHQHLQ